MALSDITKAAILDTLAEYRDLGADAFHAKWGGSSKNIRYHIRWDGEFYPSKVIVNVAHYKVMDDPAISPNAHFSGGLDSVIPVLEKHGFDFTVGAAPNAPRLEPRHRQHNEVPGTWPFVIGAKYNRRTDLHEQFGGSTQNGMISLPRFNAIALITGSGGKAVNYADRAAEDGSFRYTGEGQVGDMEFVRQNKLLRDHVEEGLDVLLFEKDGDTPYIIYKGQFVCSTYDIERQLDRNGNMRDAIVFFLSSISPQEHELDRIADDSTSLAELHKRAYAAAGPARKKSSVTTRSAYERAADVRDYVLKRANGNCEGCEAPAPFKTVKGRPYLEPHHIDRLSDGGPDSPERVAGICPNCHKRAHFADDAKPFNATLQFKISSLETKLKQKFAST